MLCGFKEACTYWLPTNILRENHLEKKHSKEGQEESIEEDKVFVDLAGLTSFARLCEKKTEADLGLNSLDSECSGAEGQKSSRKVSFASGHYLGKVVHPLEESYGYPKRKYAKINSNGHEESVCYAKNSKSKLCRRESRLPPRSYPPPLPPPEVSRDFYSLTSTSLDSLSDITSLEDSLKLLALNSKGNPTDSNLLPNKRQLSSSKKDGNNDEEDISDVDTFPFSTNYSTPESEISTGGTMTTEYYTPFQSFHNYQCSNHHSVPCNFTHKSSSAPSFLIGSSTELCQCEMDDSATLSDFKAYLQKMSEKEPIQIHTPDTLKSPEAIDDVKVNSLGTLQSVLFPLKNITFAQYDEDDSLDSDLMETNDDEGAVAILSTSEVKVESEPDSTEPKTYHRDIALSDLLDRIDLFSASEVELESEPNDSIEPKTYHREISLDDLLDRIDAENEATIKSGEANISCCSSNKDSDDKFFRVDQSDAYANAASLANPINDDFASETMISALESLKNNDTINIDEDDDDVTIFSSNEFCFKKVLDPASDSDQLTSDEFQSFCTSDDMKYKYTGSALNNRNDSHTDSSEMAEGTICTNNTEDSVITLPSLPIKSFSSLVRESCSSSSSFHTKDISDGIRAIQPGTKLSCSESEKSTSFQSLEQGTSECQSLYYLPISKIGLSSSPGEDDNSVNVSESKRTFTTSLSNEIEDSVLTTPSIPLKTVSDDYFSSNGATTNTITSGSTTGTITASLSQTMDSLDIEDCAATSRITFKMDNISSDCSIPSLSVKIIARSSLDDDSLNQQPYKTGSTPESLGPKSTGNEGITVREPPSNSPSEKCCEEESIGNSCASGNSSQRYIKKLLLDLDESKSVSKSVHYLCERAIIKQSNISLEVVLPMNEFSKLKDMGSIDKLESQLTTLQLSSPTRNDCANHEKKDIVGKERA